MFSTIPSEGRSWNIHLRQNHPQSQGLIYIDDHNFPDIEDYGGDLKKEYILLDVQKAIWMKTKNIISILLIPTFKEKEPPKFKEVPEEQAKTKVYEHYERPMSCKSGHAVKRSNETMATCARCSW